jgi:hypothetical protein
VERRISPILFLLKNIQRENSYLIPNRIQVSRDLSTPGFRTPDRWGVTLDEV